VGTDDSLTSKGAPRQERIDKRQETRDKRQESKRQDVMIYLEGCAEVELEDGLGDGLIDAVHQAALGEPAGWGRRRSQDKKEMKGIEGRAREEGR
jgi:hypothetical protein